MENKELASLGRTDASSPLVVGNRVYDPLIFNEKIIKFSRKQYLFLNTYRLGVALEEAAAKADLTIEQVERFLDKPDVKAWLEDRALQDHIKKEWEEPAKWWSEGDKVWRGEKNASKPQIVVWQEFGQRICPKKVESSGSGAKVTININPQALKEAFERQEVIDGELA